MGHRLGRTVSGESDGRLAFIVAATLTTGVALILLLRNDRAPAPPAPAPALARVRPTPYIDSRQAVAHPSDLAATSTTFALRWLVRHQAPDGSWRAGTYSRGCDGKPCPGRGGDEYDVGVTALAALAILESGRTRPKVEEPVRRALRWLAERQDDSGCFGPRVGKYVYGHAMATLAFARAAAILGDEGCRVPASRGVRFLEMARNPGLAWRYGVRDGQNDTSVTAWAGAALLAASEVGIDVDPYAFEGIGRWLDEVTGVARDVSYRRRGGGNSSVSGVNDHYESNEGLTAAGLWLRRRVGPDRESRELAEAARRLVWNLPVWNEDGTSVDYTAWFSGTRALAAWGDPELWSVWRERLLKVLASHQRRYHEGCLAGSWDPVDKWGGEGGRVYATSINLLTLGLLVK